MCGHPKEMASHGAEFPCVSARAKAYYGWSMQLTDFFVLEGVAHTPYPLIPGGCRGDAFATEIWHGERLSGAHIKDGRKLSLFNACGISSELCYANSGLHTVGVSPCKGVGIECTAPGQVCAPRVLSFIVGEREAQWVTGKMW